MKAYLALCVCPTTWLWLRYQTKVNTINFVEMLELYKSDREKYKRIHIEDLLSKYKAMRYVNMKLIFYINSIGRGGAERVIVNLANFFHQEGNNVMFITSYPADSEYELINGIQRINLEPYNQQKKILVRNFSRVKKLREFFRIYQPDIVISFMAEAIFR